MKKVISYVVVFVLGFVVCAWSLKYFYGESVDHNPESATGIAKFAPNLIKGGTNPVRDAAKIISAYVVNIDTEGRPIMQPSGFGFEGMFDAPQQMTPRGKGSGVIFTEDGYILTNNHVVAGAAKLTVTLHDGKTYTAKLIGRDPTSDLAVIKIDAKNLSYAKFADSDKVDVGDWVIAVGNALGRGTTVTVGIVSATKRGPIEVEGKSLEKVIQTDAAINPGNSGGALANLNGDLIGINSAIASTQPNGGSIGIGFAIPSDSAKTIAEQLVKNGRVVRPYLGVKYIPLNDQIRANLQQMGYKRIPKSGAVVAEVFKGGPADRAGLRSLDIIVSVNGKQLSSSEKPGRGESSISDAVSKGKVGDLLNLEVAHPNGQTGKITIRLGEMPAEFLEQPTGMEGNAPQGSPMPMPYQGFPGIP